LSLFLTLFAGRRRAFFPPGRRFGARFTNDWRRFTTNFRLRPILGSWDDRGRGALFRLRAHVFRPLAFLSRGLLPLRFRRALDFLARRGRHDWRTCVHAIGLSGEGPVCRPGFNRLLP
jgi:hypothetical protein